MGLSNPTAQGEVIQAVLENLGPYEADIWFNELISRIPRNHNLPLFPPDPPTPLMQKTVENRHICIIGKNGHPKPYTQNDPVFLLCMPFLVRDVVYGAVQVSKTDSQTFTPDEIDFLEELISGASIALEISHQTILKDWRWEQLSLVRSVSDQIANVSNVDDLCHRVTKLIRDSFQFYAVNIFTVDQSQRTLRFRANAGPSREGADCCADLSAELGKGIIGQVAESGEEILCNDVTRESRFVFMQELPFTKSEAALPLKVEGRVLGVLDLQSDHLYAFQEVDLPVLRSLASNIALAIEGSRLYSALERRVEQLAIVSEVGKAFTSILDMDQLFTQVVHLISERFEYPFVHLFLVQPDSNQLIYRAGAGERAVYLDKQGLVYEINDPRGIIPWVGRNGVTVIANDVAREPQYRPSNIGGRATVAEMALPLRFGDDILGVLDVQSDVANRFDEEEKALFETLADSIAIAIRNSKLYNAEKWRRKASDSLREVAGLLPASIPLDDLMEKILQELEQVLPCESSAIWLVDEDTRTVGREPILNLAAAHGVSVDRMIASCGTDPNCVHWLKRALDQPNPTVRTEKDPYGPLGLTLQYPSDYSSIAAPMRVGDSAVGLITLAHPTPRRYGVESIHMTSAFASYAAVAIQNSRLYNSAEEQAWVSTVLLQVAEAARSVTSVEDLLQTIVHLTPMLVGIQGCSLFLWDANQEVFQLSGSHGIKIPAADLAGKFQIRTEESAALLELEISRQPILIHDPHRQVSFLEPDPQVDQYALIPLLSRGDLMGAYLVGFFKSNGEAQSTLYSAQGNGEKSSVGSVTPAGAGFSPPVTGRMLSQRMEVIQGIAHITSTAMDNIRLLEQQQQESYVSAVLLQVAQTVAGNNNLEDIFAAVIPMIPMLAGSKVCMLYLWEQGNETYALAESTGLDRVTEQNLCQNPIAADQSDYLFEICANNRTMVIPLSQMEEDTPESWLNIDPTRAVTVEDVLNQSQSVLIGIPLDVKDENFGALLVVDSGKHPTFLSRRMEIIAGIARQISLAIQNDRLQTALVSQERMEREFQLAREMQQTFLPEVLPRRKGWEMDSRWRPARDVGGDFYDLFDYSKDQLAVMIADVSDKGISAALYMTLTRTVLRTISRQKVTPAAILTNVNDILLHDTPHGVFVTALFGILNLRTGALVYANAGHNLPIVWRSSSQKLENFHKGGMPLGISEEAVYREEKIQLHHSDVVLFYTDGITDTTSGQDMFGEKRLAETIVRASQHTADGILTNMDRALMDFQGSTEPADDVTALAIRRL